MSVDYDRMYCEEFAERCYDLPRDEFVSTWYYFAFRKLGTPISPQTKVLMEEFNQLSLWNQQGVLFCLADWLASVANDVAQERAGEARTKEPL